MPISLGRFIVKDEKICYGEPVFVGTRILVSDVLEQVASGMDWTAIIDEWRGSISLEAISEAVRLAKDAFTKDNPSVPMEQLS